MKQKAVPVRDLAALARSWRKRADRAYENGHYQTAADFQTAEEELRAVVKQSSTSRAYTIPEGKAVHHIDGNPNNNRLDNLQLVDIKEKQ